MKNVLYIGAGAPWKGGAGYLVRQRMMLRALADAAHLTLAMFHLSEADLSDRPEYAPRVTALPEVPRVQLTGLRGLTPDLFSPLPRMLRWVRPQAARQAVADLNPDRFDAVFAFRIDFAFFAGVLDHPRLLLDIDDPEHLRGLRQLAAQTQDGGDWRTRRDLEKLARFEKTAARQAMASFVCQENDRDAFDPPPIVVPNCVDVPPNCPPRKSDRPRIIFIGNFASAGPNADGLRWFLADIWPLIHAEVPACEFHVVGRLSTAVEHLIGAMPGARAVGFVRDLGNAMAEASLSIAPIRFGTGTRVKIIESFALGCPVVSTTLGAEGIDAAPGEQILIADQPADFARQCVGLLRDEAAQARIGAAGYNVANLRYNASAYRRELSAIFSGLLDRCSADGHSTASVRAEPSAAVRGEA